MLLTFLIISIFVCLIELSNYLYWRRKCRKLDEEFRHEISEDVKRIVEEVRW